MRCPKCGSYDVSEDFDVCYSCGLDRRSKSCADCCYYVYEEDCDGPGDYYCTLNHMYELPNESIVCTPCLDYRSKYD